MFHLFESSLQFISDTHQICSIVLPDRTDCSSSSRKSMKHQDEGISIEGVGYFNVHSATGKTGEQSTITLSFDLLSLIISSLNISIPQYVNGVASVHLSCGRSVIFWYPIFPHTLWHIANLCVRCRTIVLPLCCYFECWKH